ILKMTEHGPLTATKSREDPRCSDMRPIEHAKRIYRGRRWSDELFDALVPLVCARGTPESSECPVETGRVGFGYALVFSGQSFGSSGLMRIMPVAHTGPAGVVEAQGILLERVKCYAPDSELRRKGEKLDELVGKLEKAFGQNVLAAAAA